jgi:hypothetical protein
MDRKKAYGYPINTRIIGTFFNKYPGGKEIEELYRQKKLNAFREIEGTLSGEKPTDKQADKIEKLMAQRRALIAVLKEKTSLKWNELSEMLKAHGCVISANKLSHEKGQHDTELKKE